MALSAERTLPQLMNFAPADLNPEGDLPRGFFDFLLPLHKQFTPRQQNLAARRMKVLQAFNTVSFHGRHLIRRVT